MKGTRPLNSNKIHRVSACFTSTFDTRKSGLFTLGVSTGGRISELLSLTIGDVYQNRAPVTDLLYDKSIVKGGVDETLFLELARRGYNLSKFHNTEILKIS